MMQTLAGFASSRKGTEPSFKNSGFQELDGMADVIQRGPDTH